MLAGAPRLLIAGKSPALSGRQHALQRLIERRASEAAAGREAGLAADRLARVLRLHRGLTAFRAHAAARQAAERAAAQTALKRWFLLLAQCWDGWRRLVTYKRRLAAKRIEAAAMHAFFLSSKAMLALRQHVTWRQQRRRTKDVAEAFSVFCALSSALDAWRASTLERCRQRAACWAAEKHWARRTRTRAFACWARATAAVQHWRAAHEAAAALCRASALRRALRRWRATVQALELARDAAAAMIAGALFGTAEGLLGMCLGAWRLHARQRQRRREDAYVAARLRRFLLMGRAWRGLRGECCWRHHLRRLELSLAAQAGRLTLHFALVRWEACVDAQQAQGGWLCYRALQLPRVLSAWRRFAASQAQLRSTYEHATMRHAQRMQAAALASWQRYARSRAWLREMCEVALTMRQWRVHAMVLAAWQHWTQRRLLHRSGVQAADAAHRLRVCRGVLAAWRRRVLCRQLALHWRPRWLVKAALCGWLAHARYKAGKANAWRRAVRLRYLHLLAVGLAAFQQQLRRQRQASEHATAMAQQAQQCLLRRALTGWAAGVLPATRASHELCRWTASRRQAALLRIAWVHWRGPFLSAGQARRVAAQRAQRFWSANKQGVVLTAWRVWAEKRAAERKQLRQTVAFLQRPRQRRVLAAWRVVCQVLQRCRWQAVAAQGHASQARLRICWLAWQRACDHQQRKRAQWCAALLHHSRHLQLCTLIAWRDVAAQCAMLKRVGMEAAILESAGPEAEVQGRWHGAAADEPPSADDEVMALLCRLQQLRQEAWATPAGSPPSCEMTALLALRPPFPQPRRRPLAQVQP